MGVTLTMGNGVETRMADGRVKVWSTGRLGRERVGRAIELVSRLEEGEGVDARSPWWGSMINRPSWVRSRRPANRQLAIT